ncbi:MAG: tetratricopeptide repeat protein [Pirellulaceae bacterium]|nr:tetratricopeptide repeat protein [Pirellulaceae bacterium]
MAGTSWQAIRATRAEAEAANSALKADSVNKFLVNDLLGLAGAESQLSTGLRPDPNLKLIALLDRALGEVDGRFAAQPQVAAMLKETLANSCVSVGRYDDAARLYGEYLMFLLQERGSSHPDTIRAMRQLAIVQIYRLRFAEAEAICKQAIAALEKCEPGQRDLEMLMLQMKSTRATVFQRQKRYSEALVEHEQCLEAKRRILVQDHPEVCYSMSVLAELHECLNQFDEAERLHSEVLQIRRRQFPGSHPLVAASLHDLGRCYLKHGQASHDAKYLALSEPLLTECFKTYLDVRGEDHPDTLASQSSLTQLYCEYEKYNEAQLLLKDLVVRLDRTTPDQLPNLEARNALGWALMQTGKYAEAENMLTAAQEGCKQLNLDNDLPIVLRVKGNLAIAYQRLGKLEQSIFLDEELSVVTTRIFGRNHVESLASKARLGLSKIEIGQMKAGQELLTSVFEDGQHMTEVFKIATLLANSFAKQRDADQVELWTNREVESARAKVPAGSAQLAEILAAGGTRLLGISKWSTAEALLREGQEIYLSQNAEPSSLCALQAQLGHALAAQKKFQAALPNLVSGYEGCKDGSSNRQGKRTVDIKTTLTHIIACCDALEKTEDAAKYRVELTRLRTTR